MNKLIYQLFCIFAAYLWNRIQEIGIPCQRVNTCECFPATSKFSPQEIMSICIYILNLSIQEYLFPTALTEAYIIKLSDFCQSNWVKIFLIVIFHPYISSLRFNYVQVYELI